MLDSQRITASLQPLIGLQLATSYRTGSMRIFPFGRLRLATSSRFSSGDSGKLRLIGDLALHVQCPWRLETERGIVTGFTDLWRPIKEEEGFSYEEWDWDTDGNLQDAHMEKYFCDHTDVRVMSVELQTNGSFTLHLSSNTRLLFFAAGATSEDWRLFKPDTEDPHFVVSGGRVEVLNS
jgi:hypothetical protein